MTEGNRAPSSGSRPLRLGLVQFEPSKGDVEANLQRIRAKASDYAGQVDLLVFPETAVTGYDLQGAVESLAQPVEAVASALGSPSTNAPDLLLGFYERGEGALHNSVVHMEPGESGFRPLHVHRKAFLPTYGIFDEGRFVRPGSQISAYDTRFGRMGAMVCEDALHSIVPTLLALDGARLLVTVAAAPVRGLTPETGAPQSLVRWERATTGAAGEHGVFAAVTHTVGSEGGKLYPGSALVAGPRGDTLARGPLLESSVVTVELDPREVDRARAGSPMLEDLRTALPTLAPGFSATEREAAGHGEPGDTRPLHPSGPRPHADAPPAREPADGMVDPGPRPGDLEPLTVDPDLVERFLVRFLQAEFFERGFTDAVVGVSGGLDSAVSLMLAVRALGPGHVHAFALPDSGSRAESAQHAQHVAEAAGVELRTVPVGPMVEAYVESAEPDISPPRRGNAAARMRALVLFDQAARYGALPLGTGNKSERLLGYFTWHGDDAPPINPLGDLFKTQVVQLARHLGVPEPIVTKPPSADLVPGVDDADELGMTYDEADPILHWLLQGYRPQELVDRGFPEGTVRRVAKILGSTHWKRNLPTTAVVSETAIGAFYLRPVDLREWTEGE